MVGGQGGEVHEVGLHEGRSLAAAGLLNLLAGFIDHARGEVQEGHAVARFEQLATPLARSAAQVDDRGPQVGGQVRLEVLPGEGVVPEPPGVVVDLLVAPGDPVVVLLVGVAAMAAHGRKNTEYRIPNTEGAGGGRQRAEGRRQDSGDRETGGRQEGEEYRIRQGGTRGQPARVASAMGRARRPPPKRRELPRLGGTGRRSPNPRAGSPRLATPDEPR